MVTVQENHGFEIIPTQGSQQASLLHDTRPSRSLTAARLAKALRL